MCDVQSKQRAREERRNEFDDLVSIAASFIERLQSIRLATTFVVERGLIAPHALLADLFPAGTIQQQRAPGATSALAAAVCAV